MPSASERTAIEVNPGLFARCRAPNRMSRRNSASQVSIISLDRWISSSSKHALPSRPSSLIQPFAKDQDVAVRIANFKLPIAIELLLQGRQDEILAFDTLVERMNPLHPKVCVPQTFRPHIREVRF